MLHTILQALKKNEIKTYLINHTKTEGAELYFIKKELDMRRMKEQDVYTVIVYRDFEEDGKKMRGSSTVRIFPEMEEADVEKAISGAYFAASFVKNPYYELTSGEKKELVKMKSRLTGMKLEEIMEAFVKALYEADHRTDSFINTSEFFVSKETVSICNSQGVDVSYEKSSVTGEFVVQCKEPQDVEQYQDFSYIDLDTDALTKQAKEALEMVCARANATTAPKKGDYNVILSGKEMRQLLSLYTDRAGANFIYPGYSNYEKGMQVQGENVTGEKLNIVMKAVEPYSSEGIAMKDLELLKDGELKSIYGNARFAYYLGVEPTGWFDSIEVSNGTMSFEEMKQEPYLHVVSFSSFDMDALGGHFGGEIRLAYLYDGEKVTPVTGGSINGNLLELQKDMVFTTDRYKDNRYDGPMAVRLNNVPVAGV